MLPYKRRICSDTPRWPELVWPNRFPQAAYRPRDVANHCVPARTSDQSEWQARGGFRAFAQVSALGCIDLGDRRSGVQISPARQTNTPFEQALAEPVPGRPFSRGLSGPSNPLKCPYRPDSAWEAGAQVCRRACHKGSRADFPSLWRSLFQDARPCGRRRGRRLPEWDPGPSRTARSSPIRTASTRGDQTRVSSRHQSLSHLRP